MENKRKTNVIAIMKYLQQTEITGRFRLSMRPGGKTSNSNWNFRNAIDGPKP